VTACKRSHVLQLCEGRQKLEATNYFVFVGKRELCVLYFHR